jgi:transcriptional regulator with XRE-family HTH domain
MDRMEKEYQSVERQLFDSLSSIGGIIPHTVEQVELAERAGGVSGVALPDRLRDPQQVFARITERVPEAPGTSPPRVFGQFVSMWRKDKGISVDALAEKAKVEAQEICQIEVDLTYEPKPRTVSQLAKAFGLPPMSLARLANLTSKQDDRIVEGAVRFAACSTNMDKLTREQRQALNAFVKLLHSLD